jgi:hypothetical protein
MPDIPPAIDVYPGPHLPIIKADADPRGLVGRLNHAVPREMDVDAGTMGRGRVLATRRGRSPLYRLEESGAPQDPALR